MGRAIKKLYEESLTDTGLANLLDAVLAQRSTPEQFQQFQNYVRTARANPEPSDLPGAHHGGQRNSTFFNNNDLAVQIKIEDGLRRGGGGGGGGCYGSAQPAMMAAAVKNSSGPYSDPTVSPRTFYESPSAAVAVGASTDEPSTSAPLSAAVVFNPSQLPKLPSYEELKQDSHIRSSPSLPTPPARTRGRKRARSHSPSQNIDQPSTAPAAAMAAETTPPALLSAIQAPTLVQHPKKKSKTNKIKVS